MLIGNKSDLRAYFLNKRKELSSIELQVLSLSLSNQFKTLSISKDSVVSVYLPIGSKNEVNTFPMIDYLLENGIKVVCPIADWKAKSIDHVLYDKNVQIVQNKGIPEILNGIPISNDLITHAIVPALCIDQNGIRLGYGGGFYDRFLVKRSIQSICLSIFPEISSILDAESFDIAIDIGIFPENIKYYFNEN